VTQAGGQSGSAIATDGRGNSYVTGGDQVIVVAKYDRNGQLLWAKQASPAEDDASAFPVGGRGIATDPRGNIYVTGAFEGTTTFEAGEDSETVLSSAGFDDIFVAKYDRNGQLLWAKQAGDIFGIESGFGIATDAHGNSYVTGISTFDMFVAKYDPKGLLLWATSGVGSGVPRPGLDAGLGVAADPRGNIYVTGHIGRQDNVLGPFLDIFVAKFRDRIDQDQCPDSDRSATVVLDGNDTGVDNALTGTGCTIMDLIRQASDEAADRTEFIRGVALLTRSLLRGGLINVEEAGVLRTAASQATFPLS
jgi:hypothetical protein